MTARVFGICHDTQRERQAYGVLWKRCMNIVRRRKGKRYGTHAAMFGIWKVTRHILQAFLMLFNALHTRTICSSRDRLTRVDDARTFCASVALYTGTCRRAIWMFIATSRGCALRMCFYSAATTDVLCCYTRRYRGSQYRSRNFSYASAPGKPVP